MSEAIRLNKYLSDAGVCSRRQADRYVETGRITVDGVKAVMGQKVSPDQEIRLNGKLIGKPKAKKDKVILAFYKPRGIVCTTQKKDPDNIIDYINYPERIYPVGRLDKDSEGLILLTNDGDMMNKILCARNYHEKEYEVKVNKAITERFLKKMSSGVEILETKTRPCRVEKMGEQSFRIILTQGLNRQIRRMCESQRYEVRQLKRVRIMNILLGDLKEGQYREITGKEKRILLEDLEKENRKNVQAKAAESKEMKPKRKKYGKTPGTGPKPVKR